MPARITRTHPALATPEPDDVEDGPQADAAEALERRAGNQVDSASNLSVEVDEEIPWAANSRSDRRPRAPRGNQPQGTSFDPSPHGISAATGGMLRSGKGPDRTATVGASLERGAFSAVGETEVGDQAVSGSAYLERGYAEVATSMVWADRDGGINSAGLYAGGRRDNLLFGIDSRTAGLSDGTTVASVDFDIGADRSVNDLGAYRGEDPTLAGHRKIELRVRSSKGMGLGTGQLAASLATGGTVFVDRGKSTVWRTHLPADEARSLLSETGGAAAFFKNKGKALGLAKETADIPTLSDPDAMQVGDELIVGTRGSFSTRLAVGSPAGVMGLRGSSKGEFDLALRKVTPDVVELVVTPSRIRSLRLYAGSGLTFEVGHLRSNLGSLRQAFEFDLSKPEARAAYERAIAGELPGGALPEGEESEGLREQLSDEHLAPGVSRSYTDKLELEARTTGGGLTFGPIQDFWGITGLARYRTRIHEQRVVADGDAAVFTDSRGIEKRRQLLLSGTETQGVTAAVRRVTEVDDEGASQTRFKGIDLRAHFTDLRARNLELNHGVVDQINQTFGTQIDHFTRPGRNLARRFSVLLELTPKDLAALARSQPSVVSKNARYSRIKPARATRLISDLRNLRTDEARAERLQAFIVSEGLCGMGFVHCLLGGNAERLEILGDTDLYTDALKASATARFRYEEPFPKTVDKDTFLERFTELNKARLELGDAWSDVVQDPFLSEAEKEALDDEMADEYLELEKAMSVKHLGPRRRDRLHRELGRGWVSGKDWWARAHLLDEEAP